jgi:hypothetical protein
LNFSVMMRMIHEGIEESVEKGGKSIMVKWLYCIERYGHTSLYNIYNG